MKAIKCELPNIDQAEILALADMHIGDASCNFSLIQERINYIKNTPNCYCILNGDLMDTAIASSIGDTYSANLNPMEQLKQCVKIFEPIAHKIICIVPGNHERRVYKTDGIDMTYIMASQLGIEKSYTETTAMLFISIGEQGGKMHYKPVTYTAYITHGCGGGRKEGGKINRLADLAEIVDADIYIHSHTHLPAIFKNTYYRADVTKGVVMPITRLFVNTSAYLDYGGYGATAAFKPASTDTPIIYLNGRRKDAKALL